MANGDFDGFLAGLRRKYPWLPEALAHHYARLYGTRAETLIGAAKSLDGLGRRFGGLLYGREIEFLRQSEWAVTAEDVLYRRTKHGLHLSADERRAVQDFIGA
jgi:glycerol-3-phosphate dehydrogenase